MPMRDKSSGRPTKNRLLKPWIIGIIAAIIGYILIYASFVGKGFIPAGDHMEKSNWLAFLGTYLSSAATLAVSIAALKQSKDETVRRDKERLQNIQPIFSLRISHVNAYKKPTPSSMSIVGSIAPPPPSNFLLTIYNVSAHPIRHVFLYNSYVHPLLNGNDRITVTCALEISPSIENANKDWAKVPKEHSTDSQIVPTSILIHYEDIDGHQMTQKFELRETIQEDYLFSLTETTQK